jgi:hypothetical protein
MQSLSCLQIFCMASEITAASDVHHTDQNSLCRAGMAGCRMQLILTKRESLIWKCKLVTGLALRNHNPCIG